MKHPSTNFLTVWHPRACRACSSNRFNGFQPQRINAEAGIKSGVVRPIARASSSPPFMLPGGAGTLSIWHAGQEALLQSSTAL
jgi:hypothetical protein